MSILQGSPHHRAARSNRHGFSLLEVLLTMLMAVVLMALINHWMYRGAFRSGLRKKELL